jgi:Circularly permutated YpsA SLOG family
MEKYFQGLSWCQKGVDRVVLDLSLKFSIPYGSWCPKGGLSKDRPIPLRYLPIKNAGYTTVPALSYPNEKIRPREMDNLKTSRGSFHTFFLRKVLTFIKYAYGYAFMDSLVDCRYCFVLALGLNHPL